MLNAPPNTCRFKKKKKTIKRAPVKLQLCSYVYVKNEKTTGIMKMEMRFVVQIAGAIGFCKCRVISRRRGIISENGTSRNRLTAAGRLQRP